LSGTRPANHDRAEPAGDSAGESLNRLFERHRFEQFYNSHRPHRGIANALHCALPSPIREPDAATGLHIHRRDRLGGIFHEYRHIALPERMNFGKHNTPTCT
jgi:hypothetical protein